MQDTQEVLIPLVESLVDDPESVIRQHLAAQLLPMGIVCMVEPMSLGDEKNGKNELPPVSHIIEHPEYMKEYNQKGYELVTGVLIQQLGDLVADEDLDVRRAAADTLTGLAVQIVPDDIQKCILPIPLQLSKERVPGGAQPPSQRPGGKPKKSEAEQRAEDLRMTAANLLAELGGALAEHTHIQQSASKWVGSKLLPAILELAQDPSFRVRRAAAQALPRIVGTCDVPTVSEYILPAFDRLSTDELYRVRKSTGECLVDMSRSLMILASHQKEIKLRQQLHELRRNFLIPIADRLIQDEHKMVRQGMMQFLGPFMASFYPYQDSTLRSLLPTSTESDGSNHMGIVAQFFPHATSMVSRLNSSQNTVGTAPSPVLYDPFGQQQKKAAALDHLEQALPLFLQASRRSLVSLVSVVEHRNKHPPDGEDIQAIVQELLDYFAALAIVSTGDENTDAEMRVYCAYSFPAIVLLLGAENWEGALKTCFFTLLNPSFAADDDESGISQQPTEPPLPVKRCLASSLHTISHILGSEIAAMDILPVLQDFFMRDPDESVRLNVIRGFPSILAVLPEEDRSDVFLLWSKIMRGEDCLGAKKRSATNPLVLNWRQRDYLARGLPDVIGLVSPDLIHGHLWPIMKELMVDGISQVREDAIWTIPILLKAYTPETAGRWTQIKDARRFSSTATTEVLDWMKATILKVGERSRREADFVERQLYCRACATIGLALRFNTELKKAAGESEDGGFLGESFRALFFGSKTDSVGKNGPYQKLTSAESKFLRKILVDQMLPDVLHMKDDRISNVRVTLMKVLRMLPEDIRDSESVKLVLDQLEDEVRTWESFGQDEQPPPEPAGRPRPMPTKEANGTKRVEKPTIMKEGRGITGPVDVDEVQVTPSNSRDDDEDDDDRQSARGKKKKKKEKDKRSKHAKSNDENLEKFVNGEKTEEANEFSYKPAKGDKKKKKVVDPEQEAYEKSVEEEYNKAEKKFTESFQEGIVQEPVSNLAEQEEDLPEKVSFGTFDSIPDNNPVELSPVRHRSRRSPSPNATRRSPTKRYLSPPKSPVLPDSPVNHSDSRLHMPDLANSPQNVGNMVQAESLAGWYTVTFQDGPIGLQLEPIIDDKACRVYGFLDSGDTPSPARASGQISLGDVIIKVNNSVVKSYDETIDLLKRGGRREVTFRPGMASDDYDDDDSMVSCAWMKLLRILRRYLLTLPWLWIAGRRVWRRRFG